MATSFSLLKPGLKTSLVESLYNEIISNSSTYYYFLGKTLEWSPTDNAESPANTLSYEAQTREEMIFVKKITTSDVSFIAPRYDWIAGQVYDQYDDFIGGQIVVQNCEGNNNVFYITGTFDPSTIGIGYTASGTGIAPGAKVVAVSTTRVDLDYPNTGFVSGTVTFTNYAPSGASSLETARFYVITTDNNVYKCLDNNNGAISTVKPYSLSHETFQLSDGYIWKYMYTLPNALINKFSTITDIPVTTAVRSAYYSGGAINSVTITNYGQDYTSTDTLVVTGDGALKGNLKKINSFIIQSPGVGYLSPPTITVADPFTTVPFEVDTTFYAGQYVKTSTSKIYLVTSTGVTGPSEPTHTITNDPVASGTTSLQFVGYTPTITGTIVDGSLDDISVEGILGYINVLSAGSGYDPNLPPVVTITGDGVGATASALVSVDGYVVGITITDRGIGYSTVSVSIEPPPDPEGEPAVLGAELYIGFGYSITPTVDVTPPYTLWEGSAIVNNGDQIMYDTRLYEVVTAETNQLLGTEAPSHTTGTESNGAVDLLYVGEVARAAIAAIVERTQAKVVPVIENGQIINVRVIEPGEGYTIAYLNAFGAGSGAEFIVNTSEGDLNTRQANIELLAIPGTIDAVSVINPGSGYSSGSAEVVIDGDGTGFQATVEIVDGIVSKINVTNPGSGYTRATVTITGPCDIQAYARPIISPPQGHGKNAVRELFASDIALATTVAQDRNQGFIVDNDYRQLGIIKNPTQYNSSRRYNNLTGSTCFSITANFAYADIVEDMVLTDSTTGNRYRVVAKPITSTGDAFPVLAVSLDNGVPSAPDVLTYTGADDLPKSATVSNVTSPAVDKYSGDLLFIDNRNAFQPTDTQTVSIRTVIRL